MRSDKFHEQESHQLLACAIIIGINLIFVDFIFYWCVSSGESPTNWVKPEGLYIKFMSDSPEFAHR